MGGKSSGGYDTGPIEEYGEKSLALQEQMYNDSIDRTSPFYNTGVSANAMLADYLGIQGGSQQSEQQIYDSLKDQYTTTTNTGGYQYTDPETGITQTIGDRDAFYRDKLNNSNQILGFGVGDNLIKNQDYDKLNDILGIELGSGETTSTDQEALRAAVAERMAQQQDTPDNFGSLLQTFGQEQFEADPGYKFRLDEGNNAINQAAAARGDYYNPETVQALGDYNANQADQTYGDAYNRYNNDQTNIFNRLAAISGTGQQAATALNASGTNYADQASNTYGSIANAQVESNAAKAAQPSMFDTLLSGGMQLAGATYGGGGWSFSDKRIKENIEYIGMENGHKIYEFDYKDGSGRYRGVMAQDVKETDPDAVKTLSNGYMAVNYDQIGVRMEAVHGV